MRVIDDKLIHQLTEAWRTFNNLTKIEKSNSIWFAIHCSRHLHRL